MAAGYLPLAAVLLATAVALLVATSAIPVVAAAADKYSGRMVIIRAPGATVVSAGGALSKWQQHQRRLVEDEVAPEFGDGHLLGADDGLNREGQYQDRPWCPKKPCAAKGAPYTRPCLRAYGCVPGPNAEHASRAVHA